MLYTGISVAFIASVEKAFLDPEGDYDYCVNCAAETKYGQSDEVGGVLRISNSTLTNSFQVSLGIVGKTSESCQRVAIVSPK